MKFHSVAVAALMLVCIPVLAAGSGIWGEETEQIPQVPGKKIDHKGLVINPVPHDISMGEGTLDISGGVTLAGKGDEYKEEASFLPVVERKGVRLSVQYGTKTASRHGLKPVYGAYFLNIDTKGIDIEAYDDAGVFYAFQTLRQILSSDAVKDGELPAMQIRDWPDLPVRGVVEGFYGTPWSHEVRMSLIDFYGTYKMNTYIYGPKDDPYHSSPDWRKPYPPEEAANIRELVDACRRNRVEFVWAIHPGQDIRWDEEDYQNLVRKFEDMYGLGVRAFAIFFDDISGKGADPMEQVGLLNRLMAEFVDVKGDVAPLIICPTDYNRSWANPTPEGSLSVYGRELHPDVKVFWTGDAVCSDVTPSTLEWVGSRIKRPALLWWNFPVTDYVRHIVMQGPSYGLDATLTDNNLCGLVSNPMEHGEASKLALYGVADYTWNVQDYNALDNWERGLVAMVPDASDAYRTFAIHSCDTETGYRRAESWETKTFTIDNYTESEFNALKEEFGKIATVPERMQQGCANKALLKELEPWLVEFGKLGERGLRTMDLIKDYESEDPYRFWTSYVNNLMSEEEREAYKAHRSGTMKLQPFYEEAMNEMVRGFYLRIVGRVPHMSKALSSYSNVAVQGDLMTDNDSTTYYTSAMAQKTGDWIGMDIGGIRGVREVSVLQGRNSVDDVDYFDHAVLEYSKDGKFWIPLVDSLQNAYVVEWEGEPVDARYVRLRKLDSKKTNWAAVRSFDVNPMRYSDLEFQVEAADTATVVYAFDRNPRTCFGLNGMLRFEVQQDVRKYILLSSHATGLFITQMDERGKVLSSNLVTGQYSEIQVVPGAASIKLEGEASIYEVIAKNVQ